MSIDRDHCLPRNPQGLPAGMAIFFATFATATVLADTKPSTKIDFIRDVRPIFAENCYTCHGPDEGKRKAGVRPDLKDEAFKQLKSDNFAIVPGDVAKSSLIQRLTTKDEDERMPPLKTG